MRIILVHLLGPCVTGVYRHESEVLDYDSDSSIFWIQEGVGFDYWFDSYCDFPEYLDEGFFVIEGITGEYIRGEGGWDDDEEWSHTGIRQATDEEIQGCGLGDKI